MSRPRDATTMKTRFVLVCRPHTGSSYLEELLNSHDNVVCTPQIKRVAKSLNVPLNSKINALEFIEENIFKRNSEKDATGFKVKILEHSFEEYLRMTYPEMLEHLEGVKAVRLKRWNLLECFVERCLCILNKNWGRTSEPFKIKRIQVNITDCLEYFNSVTQQEDLYDKIFRNYEILEIQHKDLMLKTESTLNTIQDFLNVSQMKMKTTYIPRDNIVLDEMIENYDQIKQELKDSPWGEFFRSL